MPAPDASKHFGRVSNPQMLQAVLFEVVACMQALGLQPGDCCFPGWTGAVHFGQAQPHHIKRVCKSHSLRTAPAMGTHFLLLRGPKSEWCAESWA
jgi:hypothetical protein